MKPTDDPIANPDASKDEFNEALNRLIDQIQSIKKIKWITDTPEASLNEVKNLLDRFREELMHQKREEDEQAEAELRKEAKTREKEQNERRKEYLQRCWITLWCILSVFTVMAVVLLVFAVFQPCFALKVTLFTGGMVLLLIIAAFVFVLARQMKSLFVLTK